MKEDLYLKKTDSVEFQRYHFSLSQPWLLSCFYHVFPPSLVDRAFVKWSNLSITKFEDLYVGNVFTIRQISKVDYFGFLQVHCSCFRFFLFFSFVVCLDVENIPRAGLSVSLCIDCHCLLN